MTLGVGTDPIDRSFDGTRRAATTPARAGIDWSHVRGAFMIDGTLFTRTGRRALYRAAYDGTTFGAATSWR